MNKGYQCERIDSEYLNLMQRAIEVGCDCLELCVVDCLDTSRIIYRLKGDNLLFYHRLTGGLSPQDICKIIENEKERLQGIGLNPIPDFKPVVFNDYLTR